jgi:DNA-binding Lrp family transcriptional regulator
MKPRFIEELEKNIGRLIPIEGASLVIDRNRDAEGSASSDFSGRLKLSGNQVEVFGEWINYANLPLFRKILHNLKVLSSVRPNALALVVAPYLSPERQNLLKKEGIFFIDLSGNIFLHHGALYIEKSGFANRFPEMRMGRGPFSDKASLILRILLSEGRKLWGVRELARKLGLDPGFVSRMVRELESRAYVARVDSKIRLRQPKAILEDWVRYYSYRRNRPVPFFCMASGPDEILGKLGRIRIPKQISYALCLHAGAALVAPHAVYSEVHCYVGGHDEIEFFGKKLELEEARQGANLIFLLPYYKNSAFYGRQQMQGLAVSSDIQLYLDLYHYPLRGLEQAEHLYEKRLKAIMEP